MPLQIRRGNTAEINAYTPEPGELIFNSQTTTLSVGNGSAVGGLLVGINAGNAKDAAAAALIAGSHQNISFSYNSVTKAISANVDILAHGTIEADAIDTAAVKDGSTVVLDVANAILYADVVGNATGNVSGIVTGQAGSSLVGNVTGNVVGNVVGNLTGNVVGDVKGSIFGDDSNKIVDAVSNEVYAAGGFFGNLIGSIQTNSIQSPDANRINIDSETQFNDVARIASSVEQPGGHLQIESFINTSFPTNLVLRKNRGTSTAPLSAQNGDFIGQIQFNAFDGVGISPGASIQTRVTGAVAAGRVPTTMSIFTTNAAGLSSESLTITQDGGIVAYTTSKALSPFRLLSSIQDDVGSNYILLDRNRGTRDSPQSLNSEDTIFGVGYRGYDGTKYVVSGIVSTAVDGPINTGQFYSIPGRIEFRNVDLDGDLDIRMVLSSEGILKVRALGGIEVNDAYIQNWIQFDVMPRLPDFADESAANASIDGLDPVGISPNEMNGMMYYDTALGKIRGRAGGVWVDLH